MSTWSYPTLAVETMRSAGSRAISSALTGARGVVRIATTSSAGADTTSRPASASGGKRSPMTSTFTTRRGRGTAASALPSATEKNSSGGASSTIRPSSIISTELATWCAKRSSCETTTIVMPSFASDSITSSTSRTSSTSSADVGSSNSIAFGLITSARAIATRCCWPPDSSSGYWCALSASPTRARNSCAAARASFLPSLRTSTSPHMTLSSAVMFWKRLKRWNTIPTSERCGASAFSGSPVSCCASR